MRINKRTRTAYTDESRLFYVALFSCVCVVVAYMYFVSSSIVHVVMRKEVDAQIAQLNSSVSQLEADYIERQHAVSSDFASQQGFVAVEKKIFIDRTTDTLVLSHNERF